MPITSSIRGVDLRYLHQVGEFDFLFSDLLAHRVFLV